MKLPMLNCQLMMLFNFEPPWEFQMSTQIIAESELEEALMTHGFEGNLISLKIWDSLRTFSAIWEVISSFIFFAK